MPTTRANGYTLRHTDALVKPLDRAKVPLIDAADALAYGDVLRALGKVRAALVITRAHRARAATSPELAAAAGSPAVVALLAGHEARAAVVLQGVADLLAGGAGGQGR